MCARSTEELDVRALESEAEQQITTVIENEDVPGLLVWHDNKRLLALAAKHLRNTTASDFKEWLERILRQNAAPGLTSALKDALPDLP